MVKTTWKEVTWPSVGKRMNWGNDVMQSLWETEGPSLRCFLDMNLNVIFSEKKK